MAFLDLVNQRLDYIKAYQLERYYVDHVYIARKWVKKWGTLNCSEISSSNDSKTHPTALEKRFLPIQQIRSFAF